MESVRNTYVERRLKPLFDLVDRWVPEQYEPRTTLGARDFAVAVLLGAVAAQIALFGYWQFDPLLYSDPEGYNVWFEADAPRVLGALLDRTSKYHVRNEVHPIFSLLSWPVFSMLTSAGLTAMQAGAALTAVSGFLASAFLFLALRGLGLPLFAGILFVAVFLSSAAYLHWFTVLETFAVGSATICFSLFVLTAISSRRLWVWGVASVATLAITTTNWLIWLSSAFFRLAFRRFLQVAILAVVIVIGLSIVQSIYMPTARLFFLPQSFANEVRWVRAGREGWRPDRNLQSIVVASAVAPAPAEGTHFGKGGVLTPIVSYQAAPLFSYGPAGAVAIVCWLGLLGTGIYGGVTNIRRRAVFLGAGGFVAAQAGLHLVYGAETFLYASHYFPAMVLIASLGWFTPLRWVVVGAAAVFVVAGGIENLNSFEASVRLANDIVTR